MTGISLGSLAFILSLADYRDPGTTADMLVERAGAEGEQLTAAGVLSPGPNRTMIDVELSAGDGSARIEDDPVGGGFRYFHPEDGYISLAPSSLRTWRLDLSRLAALVAHLLGMPASFRPTQLVDGLLWDLGTPRLGKKNIPVLFAVRLGEAEVRARVRGELDLRRGKPPALVLTSGRTVADDITLPTVSRIVPVLDALDKRMSAVKTLPAALDLSRLAVFADPRPAVATGASGPVQCNSDGTWIRIHGREFTFRRKQARIVRILFDAWERGDEWFGEETVLAEAEYDSKRLQDAFKGNRDWQDVIEVQAGRCRLRIDDPS
ncbi:hypothetical protein [Magnetospirillum sp. UT-4]|uniref:hypothetical protein n=1 Tax=Magnetospirillum sp. UT-4 TaxID=2681467 RepID=UPI0013830CB2|nr:hypothetical protein [Magnetospirillum sp. UT-4]CAA7615778.1 conserved hypothetical protein [Magnetospirillum sp. UT-4]